MVEVLRMLAQYTQSLQFNLQYHINWVWWSMPGTQDSASRSRWIWSSGSCSTAQWIYLYHGLQETLPPQIDRKKEKEKTQGRLVVPTCNASTYQVERPENQKPKFMFGYIARFDPAWDTWHAVSMNNQTKITFQKSTRRWHLNEHSNPNNFLKIYRRWWKLDEDKSPRREFWKET